MDALTKRLIERIGELERRLAIVEGSEPNITPTIRAATSAGVQIQDDGGTLGVFVADGGNVGIRGIPEFELHTVGTIYALDTISFLGSDSAADTTAKNMRIGARHYTIAEEPVGVFYAQSTNTVNRVAIGGASSSLNAATVIQFYTAANTTTTTGTLQAYIDSSGDAWFIGDVSALTFTDRTKGYSGDALAELRGVGTKAGEIDHDTLPAFARHENGGRDLGAMISVLTVAVQQLVARVEELENA